MPTIFTKIINGEISCHKIDEDEDHLAFLDIRPIRPGHALVIPKKEVDYVFDMEDDDLARLMVAAKRVANKIKDAIPCRKISMIVCGIEVAHTHVHLIPTDEVSDLNFAKAKEMPQEELADIAKRIRGDG